MRFEERTLERETVKDLKTFVKAVKILLKYLGKRGTPQTYEVTYENKTTGRQHQFETDAGICNTMSKLTRVVDNHNLDVEDVLRYSFERWPKFTGRFSYPVPATSDVRHTDPEVVYDRCSHWTGEQLKLREELLGFIAKTVSEHIEKREGRP